MDNNVCPTFRDTIILYLQIDTSGFGMNADILSISGKMAFQDQHGFGILINPSQEIHPGASANNGITKRGDDLYVFGHFQESQNEYDALCDFFNFLKFHCNKCILVAHNAQAFHLHYLFRAIKKHNLQNLFKNILVSYCDTLQIFKQIYPNQRYVASEDPYSLYTLAEKILNVELSTCCWHKLSVMRDLVIVGLKNENMLFQYQIKINDNSYKW